MGEIKMQHMIELLDLLARLRIISKNEKYVAMLMYLDDKLQDTVVS